MMANREAKPVLAVRDLSVRYGKVEALHRAALTVEAGRIVTVIARTERESRRCSMR